MRILEPCLRYAARSSKTITEPMTNKERSNNARTEVDESKAAKQQKWQAVLRRHWELQVVQKEDLRVKKNRLV